MMKSKIFEVELIKTIYKTFTVEAKNEHEAYMEAYAALELEGADIDFWENSYCEEMNHEKAHLEKGDN